MHGIIFHLGRELGNAFIELQYKHIFINSIQAPLHLGRILTVLIFPPVFHSKECMASVLCCASASDLLLPPGQEYFGLGLLWLR